MFTEDLALTSIVVPAERLRKVDQAAVEELAENLKSQKLIYPIIVRQETGSKTYRLIAGEHRLEAFKLLGRKAIPAAIRLPDDTRIGQLEDEIEEIDENVIRKEMHPGEVKLATKKRRKLFVELEALKREQEAQLAYDEVLVAKAPRAEREQARSRLRKAAKARVGAQESAAPPGKYTSPKGPQNREAAGEFNRETAKKHSITERAVKQRLREADDIERVAAWAKVDPRDIATSCIQAGRQLEAVLAIVDTYGREVVIEAGNVHALLKRHVKAAANGADNADIVAFKSKVDAELRREELSAKRGKEEAERFKHAATMLSKAAKAVLDAQDVISAYKMKPRTIERLDQIKRELRSIADGMRVGKDLTTA